MCVRIPRPPSRRRVQPQQVLQVGDLAALPGLHLLLPGLVARKGERGARGRGEQHPQGVEGRGADQVHSRRSQGTVGDALHVQKRDGLLDIQEENNQENYLLD